METVIQVKCEKNNTNLNVKCKTTSSSDDENEHTPLRIGNDFEDLDPAAGGAVGGSGWDSDEGNLAETPSEPKTAQFIKRSPSSCDHENTPLRDPSTHLDPQAESLHPERRKSLLGVPDSYLDDLLAEPLAPPAEAVKKEERRELRLNFLDALSEAELDTNSYTNAQQYDEMDLEPPQQADNNNSESDDEKLLQTLIEKQRILESITTQKKRKRPKKKKKHDSNKRHRHSTSPCQNPEKSPKEERYPRSNGASGSNFTIKEDPADGDLVPVRDEEKSIKLINISKLIKPETGLSPSPLTIIEKRQRGVERAKTVLAAMRLKSSKAPETEFLVVNTIIKLPTRTAFMSSDVFENPSPLCNNFNVKYEFNSTSTASNINLKAWGLERLPKETTELLRLTGIDVARLMELQQNTKMLLQKLRKAQEADNEDDKTEEESAGLFQSKSTQTEAAIINQSHDVGIQSMPAPNQGVYWLHPDFNEADLTQQQINVMLALKELCTSGPISSSCAENLFQELRRALNVRRAEMKQLGH